jgi:hypothetical protein
MTYLIFRKTRTEPWEYNGELYFDYQVDFIRKILTGFDTKVIAINKEEIVLVHPSVVPDIAKIKLCLENLNNL